MVALVRVHGLRCSKASASYSAHCQPQHIVAGERFHWSHEERRGTFSASASVEPGLHPFHTARVSRAEAAQKRRVCRAGAARAHCAFTRRIRCAQRTERNGGFGFQTKVKDRFLNQRRWTCWYSCRENMQVLSATASLVSLFFLFSFWKACYLCCLPHVTLWRLSLFFLHYYYLNPQCLLNILLCISQYSTACDVSYAMPRLIRFC